MQCSSDSTILIAVQISSPRNYATYKIYVRNVRFYTCWCYSIQQRSWNLTMDSYNSTTDNTGRGLSLTLVYLDEFAFVQPRIAQEFWTSLSPTLSTGGKCFITSTPNQDDDQFARIWKDANKTLDEFGEEQELGKNGFKSFQVHWSEHPERDDAWAISERAKIGEERFRREHECEFIAWDETLINSLKLPDLEGVEPKLRQGQVRWYSTPNKGHTYIVVILV